MIWLRKSTKIRAKGWGNNRREEIRKSDQPRKSNIQIIDNPEREETELKIERIIKDKFPDLNDISFHIKRTK